MRKVLDGTHELIADDGHAQEGPQETLIQMLELLLSSLLLVSLWLFVVVEVVVVVVVVAVGDLDSDPWVFTRSMIVVDSWYYRYGIT